jgi:hypothetical protein
MRDTFELEMRVDVDKPGYAVDIRGRGRGGDPESRYQTRNLAIDRAALEPLRWNAKLYGRELTRQLFVAGRISTAFVEAMTLAESQKALLAVRLIIEPRAWSLFDLGWEALMDPRNPDQFLFDGGPRTFSRFLTASGGRPTHYSRRQHLRVLVAVASPDLGGDFARIDAQAERQRVREIFEGQHVAVEVCEKNGACTKEDLESRLRNGCDILYLACHGSLRKEQPGVPFIEGNPALFVPLIALEKPDRSADIICAMTIVEAIRAMPSPPALIVLASCESGGVGNAGGDAIFAFGPLLAVEAGVPAVVAMRGNVSLATATDFTRSLFEELLLEGRVARAVAKARRDVAGANDWHMPALFTRAPDPYAFDPEDANDGLGEEVAARCQRNVKETIGRFAFAGDRYYVPRDLEKRFVDYLRSDKTAMVIIGQSGMGKTTLVARLVNDYGSPAGHLCCFIGGEQFPRDLLAVEQTIVNALTSSGTQPLELWTRIDRYCRVRSRCLIIFIDAVNEYNRGSETTTPADFLLAIDWLASRARANFPNIRYVITSRPETWNKGVRKKRVAVHDSDGAYFLGEDGVAHILSAYSEEEAGKAYENYCKASAISTRTGSLTGLTRHLLRDPLLLMLTCEVYREGQIPAELQIGDVFSKYREQLQQSSEIEAVKSVIDAIVDEMFDAGVIIERDAIVRDTALHDRKRALYDELNPDRPGMAASYLIERNVLRNRGGQIRFTYDRFFEYLVSERIITSIRDAAGAGSDATDAAVEVIKANLAGAQKLNTVFGSLRRTLVRLQREPVEFARVIQRVAEDERGLTLVVSVLARVAMNPVGKDPDGLAVIDKLLHDVTGAIDRGAGNPGSRFPVIDAVYRMLLDTEYRIWLEERPAKRQRKHLDCLHGFFVWGMSHGDEIISGAAKQYLFFLWRDDQDHGDAVAITNRLVGLVEPIGVKTSRDEDWKVLVFNVISFFLLAIPELRSDRETNQLLAAGREMARRLGLRNWRGRLARAMLPSKLGKQGIQTILRNAPNPVDLQSLLTLVGDSALSADYRRAIGLLDSTAAFDVAAADDLRHLATVENSYVLLAVTLAFSRRYECAAGESERAAVLDLCDSIFRTGSTTAEYCTSLALYHINYFGSFATLDSMNRFTEMTGTILRTRKGRFQLAGIERNYNVIGTYGRASVRNQHLLHERPEQLLRKRPLQFAIDALTEAKQSLDFEYYAFICEDIGLLGVLIEPHEVFAVINYILVDLGRIVEEGQPRQCPFGAARATELLSTVLQSLANIRVLYTEETDRFLLDSLDAPDLYAEVVRKTPKFKLAVFLSWTFEHLLFLMVTRGYDKVGKEMLDAVREAIGKPTAEKFLVSIIRRMLIQIASL